MRKLFSPYPAMKASADSKKSRRPNGELIEHEQQPVPPAPAWSSSVSRRPIWFNTSRTSGLVRLMSDGGTTR